MSGSTRTTGASKALPALLGLAALAAAAAVMWFRGGEMPDTPAVGARAAPVRDESARLPARRGFRSPPPAERSPTPAASAGLRPPPADLAEVEALLESDPAGAYAWIASLTPASDAEAERLKVLEIRALVGMGRIGKARGETSRYYERWPNGEGTALLEHLTGAHPRVDR